MAFRDQNGKITIDEIAAQKDIQSLQKMKEYLISIKSKIGTINLQAAEFQGDTGETIKEQCAVISKQIDALVQDTDNSVHCIKTTVSKYEQIDRDLKALIEQQ